MLPRLIVALAGVLLASACGPVEPEEPIGGAALPWEALPFPPSTLDEGDPSLAPRLELGRLAFYDPILSADREVACATCHSEIWGMSDGLAVSVGVHGEGPVGPGRTGPNTTRRNSPSLWNVAWREGLFWDGRTRSLEEQALMPIREPDEMDRDPDEAVRDMAAIPEYAALFADAFPGEAAPATATNLARALADFQRTMVSDGAQYDSFVDGDSGALDDESHQGMWLFAEAGCADCHQAPLFESERYANRGITDPSDGTDLGRFEVTGEEGDRGAYRVPTLRNLRESEPYFHDGSAPTVAAAVQHEVDEQVATGRSRPLAVDEVEAIVTFLEKALIDRFHEPDRPERVPSGLTIPRDGFRIPR